MLQILNIYPLIKARRAVTSLISLDISHMFMMAHYGNSNSESILNVCIYVYVHMNVTELQFWMWHQTFF